MISIDLPLIKSASNVSLDIFETKLELKSEKPAKYELNITLPYPVNEDNGSAKFDKCKNKLIVTLPVKPDTRQLIVDITDASPPLVSELTDQPESLVPEITDHLKSTEPLNANITNED